MNTPCSCRPSDHDLHSAVTKRMVVLMLRLTVVLVLLPLANCCMPTTTIAPPTTTTTVPVLFCCPPLQVTPTNSGLADGIMTFTYNNDLCRRSVNADCRQPTVVPPQNLNAAIVGNQLSFLASAPQSVSFPGTCNANLRWEMGNPPLVIDSIECVLTNPTG